MMIFPDYECLKAQIKTIQEDTYGLENCFYRITENMIRVRESVPLDCDPWLHINGIQKDIHNWCEVIMIEKDEIKKMCDLLHHLSDCMAAYCDRLQWLMPPPKPMPTSAESLCNQAGDCDETKRKVK